MTYWQKSRARWYVVRCCIDTGDVVDVVVGANTRAVAERRGRLRAWTNTKRIAENPHTVIVDAACLRPATADEIAEATR